ncbi:hypothetical protein NM688_g441 [Phlebia brevispora]|uniref:Uncharacterized protein n=1 Tax=Phlebia brevispora TaxID=194682 RepID=A0ACC1TEJ7_9APHY|nr:hypothetical protein NM688_g441 [Phlebia brevispora]
MPLDYANVPSATLKRVNSHVFVSAHDHTILPIRSSPSIIILFGWFNARLAHEKKYVDVLQALYPTATVVLVRIDASWLWNSQASREATLEPVAKILEQTRDAESKTSFRGVLLHVMSNGGGMQLLVLSKVLAKRTKASGMVPIAGPVALVLDSLPEGNGLRCMISVYTHQSKNPIAKYASVPLLAFFYSLFYISYGGPVMQEVRQYLHASHILPGFTDREAGPDVTPRLYVYSKTDKLTPTTEVLSHIRDARRLGLDVRTEVFEDTPHVSHARVDPKRYWNAVAKMWKEASQATPAKL